ncbi:FtsX-like permease family protein [Streptococcus sanguinis]|uniref:FtsX-like permease family protein n=1 Tax=Streptococcus sanguinis TaxID=1305 RepID=A0ABD4VKP6_STRSA|nr:FtsX-like permease family protein [Streptococcus sanguinis]MCY7035285.1 FtsX-like permease family protein [Streptococcus sanguinis]
MKRKIYWKDILRSFTSSKGRFLSILILMMLGSLALVGLKVAPPNMRRTATDYLKEQRTMDLAVMADYGLDKGDQKELESIKGADVEFGYLTDVTVDEEALRVFSDTKDISNFQVTYGRLPQKEQEIALASFWSKKYKLGQEIDLTEKAGSPSVLKNKTYKIVGFVNSAELWSDKNLGNATSGSGALSAYAVVSPKAFDTDVYSIARLRYHDLEKLAPFSANYQERLEQHQTALDKNLADNGEARFKRLEADAKSTIQKGEEKISQAESELSQGKKQLEQAQSQLDQQKSQLAAAQAASSLPPDQLSQSRQQIQEAESQLNQKKAELAQAEKDLSANKDKLADAKADLSHLKEPDYHSYDRKSLPGGNGYYMYVNSMNSIESVGNIFPVVLYLVAAMVAFTTMTRFVDEERTNAGVFKALGYHSRDIIRKFALYGLVAGTLGTFIGILLGHYFLSGVISSIITRGMVLSAPHSYFYISYSILALGLSLLSSVLPAYLVARRELTEEAAHLLLPKPPVKGSKIFLERLTLIWRRLSFTQKVTARNIFRYKQRMFMTIFGVAGSVALLFAGLGIQSSIGSVPKRQFEEILRYDLIVAVNPGENQVEQDKLKKMLADDSITDYQEIYSETLTEKYEGRKETETVTLMVTDKENFEPFISLESPDKQQKLALKDGVVVSDKLARVAGVSPGGKLELDGKSVKISSVNENYFGHFAFMKAVDYQKIYGKKPEKNAYLVRLKDSSSKNIVDKANEFMNLKAVKSVSQNASMVVQFNILADSLNTTMLVLVLISILLAVVILYNLTNINVAERIRELSTIKVLGFHNKEVTLYIYRETIILSVIGMGVGLLGGFYLHRFLIDQITPSIVSFNPQVGPSVYLLPLAAVTLILTLLGFFVNYRLRRVDMLEALKSVD